MEHRPFGKSPSSSDSSAESGRRGSRGFTQPQPNYNSPAVWEALECLASVHPIELCHEAKVEHCRATRDLSGCGRYVQHVLSSCGHASLCSECSQRSEVCPVCRSPIPVGKGNQRRLRLYNKCIEAGLISKRYDDRLQEKQHDGKRALADIQRLYRLFDVALENNLVSLVCHYVTDVCMDEGAVSSDPVLAFLLDERVVKDWCKQKFKSIVSDIGNIYTFNGDMEVELASISKVCFLLTGLSNVLDVLVSSSVHAPAEELNDLHHLFDSTLKAKQHVEIMSWCRKYTHLEDVKARYPNHVSWSLQVQERKSAAVKRAWAGTGNSSKYDGSTLFIEDALLNLGIDQDCGEENEELNVFCLEEDHNVSSVSVLNSGILPGFYPFKNLRAAADALFLRGTSDMIIAKQAIFLYYLFDRHWTIHEMEWWHIIEDFAASFGIVRRLVMESLLFYLLDDHTEQALQEATRLLPEVVGPETHPKIAQVLLQRQKPDVALMVLCSAGHDGFSGYTNAKNGNKVPVSLDEAVSAIRVRVECGLLTAAFMYLRAHCTKAKQEKTKQPSYVTSFNDSKSKDPSWMERVEVLVDEFCSLCIHRNLVDRMIELPWNADEEKSLCKCLYQHAQQNPSSTSGSLLVVFFLQRHRYIEAYQFDRKLRELESNFSGTYEEESRMRQMSQWRAGLVDRSIELLPEIQRGQLKATNLDDIDLFSSKVPDGPSNILSSTRKLPGSPAIGSFSSVEPPLILQSDRRSLLSQETPAKFNAWASSTTTNIELQSPAVPSSLREAVVVDSSLYGSPVANYKIASSLNGVLPTNHSNGDHSAVRGILTRTRLRTDPSKAPPLQKSASFGKRTPFLLSDDINKATSNRFFAKDPDEEYARGVMRWRNEESSDEEMDMDIERFRMDRNGPLLGHKRR